MNKISTRFRHAFRGLGFSITKDHSVIFHFIAALLVILFGLITGLSVLEWIIILFAIGIVIGMELINSALEGFIDHIHPEKHERVGEAKDMAAAAVLVVSIVAALIGLIIFVPHFLNMVLL